MKISICCCLYILRVSDNVEVKLAEKEQDRKEGQEIKEQVVSPLKFVALYI